MEQRRTVLLADTSTEFRILLREAMEKTGEFWVDVAQTGDEVLEKVQEQEPDILIMDEPTTGLDLGGREQVMRTLSRIGEESSERAVVLVTHRLEEIPAGFDHIAIMGRKPIPAEDATEAGLDVMGNPGAGTIVYTGSLEDGLTDERLSNLFGMPIEVQHTHGRWAAYAV